MLLPINWLSKYVNVDESAQAIASRFISLGFECELIGEDTIDLEVTPNRGDILSMIGLAREYAASTGQSVKMPECASLPLADKLRGFTIEADPAAYHTISAALVSSVANQPSPAWLTQALESVGMNSIDIIVDLTNYVMFELGIPLHAFDLDRLPSQSFHVRLSTKDESFMSLKNESVKLPLNAIVVESGGEIIDLLGIRGGKSSMIGPETNRILVWAASVPRPLIRKAVKETGIRTEGAYRHERETDWDMVPLALGRFVTLLRELAGGEVSSAVSMSASVREDKIISYTHARINDLLGTDYAPELINESLTRLGFVVQDGNATVPSWRYFDIHSWEDLAEEVARLEGYTRLPHKVIEKIAGPAQTLYAKTEHLKDILASAGMVEVYTESFSGRQEAEAEKWNQDNLAVLENPVNQEFAYCRPSMVPNIVKLLALNSWADDAKVFEVGNVFPAQDLEVTKVIVAGYGKLQKLFRQWVPEEAVRVISPEDPIAKFHRLRRPITVAEIELASLAIPLEASYSKPQKRTAYRKVSIYPPSVRDVSLIVERSVDPAQIARSIQETSPENIIQVELFDQFVSDKFGPNMQSLAFHIIFQSLEGTMEATVVDSIYDRVIGKLKSDFGVTVR